jgi:hypothetical protein
MIKMKNLLKTSIILSFFALIYSGCSSTKVISDKDQSVDFSKIRTFEYFGWADNSDEVLTRFDKERIEGAFSEEGRKRGITRVESNGDVIVSLFIVTDVKTQKTANTTSTGMGMGGMGMGARGMRSPGWGWGGGMGMTQSHTVINETNYLEGTLMIEMFDKSDKKLIWQAIGTKTVNEDPKKREKGIPKKVAAIMKAYPVNPAK